MPETLTAPLQLVDIPLEGNALLRPISCTLSFYDGAAFTGLPHGQIGEHGAVVRTETLVIRTQQITDAYGSGTPECFKETPDWSAYPPDFHNNLQNDDDRLGFVLRDEEPYVEGWYRTDVKNKYDFQAGSFDYERGLVVQSKDCFDNLSEIVYDDYAFLPTEARQYYDNITPEYLSTSAEYDYRLFKPVQVNDENDNRSRFDYSPLGLLKGIALIGQYDKDQGDIVSESPLAYVPSTRFEYDLMEFYDSQKPVWVKTIQRERHWQQDATENSPTIQKIEFSDGFGRILQSRAQAEDLLFGPTTGVGALTGDSGLPADQSSNANSTARNKLQLAADNVVVNGWKVYNNKGKVVEEYEPFFSTGYVYQSAKATRFQLQKMSICYDAGGRPTQTTFPDGSCSLVVYGVPNNLGSPPLSSAVSSSSSQSAVENNSGAFTPTPWERYAYDQNDLGPLTSPSSGGGQGVGAFTPKSELIDALGRTIKTTEHKSQQLSSASFEDVVMTYLYDIQGNLIKVLDPYERQVFHYKYNLQKQPLYTIHIDSGESRVIPDALGKPIEATDAKNARTLSTFDRLQRPVYGWSKNNGTDTLRMTLRSIYGESATTPQDHNLLGKLYEQYDENGKLSMPDYDFKGNLLTKVRNVIADTELKMWLDSYLPFLVDWTTMPSILDSFDYETNSEYDALNRVTRIRLPEAVDVVRRDIVPYYNRAGALEKVLYDNAEYVSQIGYNAKGQRLLIAFGNDVMTRYAYDPVTFRLLRQRSEKFTKTQLGNTVTYAYDVGTNRQDDAYDYDLVGNILEIISEKTGCGIGGTDTLTRAFTYDPLYRLTSATGRENVPGGGYPFPGWSDTTRSTDPNTTEGYTRKYTYDKLGNIEQIRQIGTNAFTRTFQYFDNTNKLERVNIGGDSYDYNYDNAGNQTLENANRKFDWDAANRLLFFRNQVGSGEPTVEAQYLYDSSGNRVKKIVRKQGGDYEIRVYIDGVFEFHTDETETQNTIHIMDDKSRIATVRIGSDMGDTTPAIKYVLENNIGSSMVLLDNTGAEVNEQEYCPFGETSFGSYAKKRYQYVGKERDEESGMYYYGARYYSVWIGRFVSVDPLAGKFPQLTPYNNASNQPITFKDIEGLQKEGQSSPVDSVSNAPQADPVSNGGNDVTQKTEIHFINKDTGKYLGATTIEGGSGGQEYRSITQQDYNALSENNFRPVVDSIGERNIENSSSQITIDTEKINSDLSKMLEEREDANGEAKENNMVLLFDSENNIITSQVLNDTGNTHISAEWSDIASYKGGSELRSSPNMKVVGEFHTHPGNKSDILGSNPSQTTLYANKSGTETGPGMSDKDLERLNYGGNASVYAVGVFDNKTNPMIYSIDKGSADHNQWFEVGRMNAVASGQLNIIHHSITRNIR